VCSVWISPSAAGSGMSGSPSLFSTVSVLSARNSERPGDHGSQVFIAEEDDGIGDMGSADTRTVNVRTLLKDLWNWDYSPQMLKNQNSWIISLRNKGILM